VEEAWEITANEDTILMWEVPNDLFDSSKFIRGECGEECKCVRTEKYFFLLEKKDELFEDGRMSMVE